ncbi:MAG: formate C-acetyltransferase/glycerol dehydratase family glycyl radical enzyme, partial [Firmicutes bacterium]|nr:formate C-acetyltransferase/glycerol dehydratase family glycyl radical enzyme [Bacillota bacterium]
MNERVRRLRQESLDAKATISTERAEIVTECYKTARGLSAPMMRALVFKTLLERKRIYIGPGELIVGERGPGPKLTPTYPELCCHSLEDLE